MNSRDLRSVAGRRTVVVEGAQEVERIDVRGAKDGRDHRRAERRALRHDHDVRVATQRREPAGSRERAITESHENVDALGAGDVRKRKHACG